MLSYIARLPSIENELDPLIQPRPVKRVGILLITADRGLAGGFNANVIRTAAGFMRDERRAGPEVEVVTVGRKGATGCCATIRWCVPSSPACRTARPPMMSARSRVLLVDDFTQGYFDEVYMVYTDFVNTIRQEPMVQQAAAH